jgi:hypothetical protein
MNYIFKSTFADLHVDLNTNTVLAFEGKDTYGLSYQIIVIWK